MIQTILGVLTVALAMVSAEVAARLLFFESSTAALRPCFVRDDPSTGIRGVPNSDCRLKIYESPWFEYRLNNCGHRAGIACGSKPADTYRIVLIGSSMSQGFTVEREQSFAAILPQLLSKCTRRKVELYNEGMSWGTPHSMDLQFNAVLAEKPDLVLWPITPWDVDNVGVTIPSASAFPLGKPEPNKAESSKTWTVLTSPSRWAGSLTTHSRAVFWVQHLLYEDEAFYVKQSLAQPASVQAIEKNPTTAWQAKIKELNGYVADMESRAEAAGVPLVVSALPGHAQADLIASGKWPSGVNPFLFGEEVQSIAEQHGGTYLDLLSRFKGLSNIHSKYYPVDQHMTPAGHATLAGLIAGGLTTGLVPALRETDASQCATN